MRCPCLGGLCTTKGFEFKNLNGQNKNEEVEVIALYSGKMLIVGKLNSLRCSVI
jgi:hypothetical protein